MQPACCRYIGEDYKLTATLPHSGVLYLLGSASAPDKLKIRINSTI